MACWIEASKHGICSIVENWNMEKEAERHSFVIFVSEPNWGTFSRGSIVAVSSYGTFWRQWRCEDVLAMD